MARKSDRRELFRDLKKGDVAPVYYVYGPDAFMLDTAVDAIVDAALPDGTNEFNFESFRGRDVTADRIRGAAETVAFMAPRRVVLVREAQELPMEQLEQLTDYFEDPAPTTCLVIHAMTANSSLDGRLSPVKALKKAAEVYEFSAMREWEVGDVIAKQASRRGMKLAKDATAYLIDAVGTDLASLMGALEKIDLYVGPGEAPRRVTGDDVRAVVAQTRAHSIFELTEALGARQFERAIGVLDAMLLAGESAIGITVMIARHFRIVSKLHDPSVRNADKRTVARAVGVVPYFVEDYRKDARRFSPTDVRWLRGRLVDTDHALKSSRLSDRAIMEGLLFDVCFRADRPQAGR